MDSALAARMTQEVAAVSFARGRWQGVALGLGAAALGGLVYLANMPQAEPEAPRNDEARSPTVSSPYQSRGIFE